MNPPGIAAASNPLTILGLTPEQVQRLLTLIDTPKNRYKKLTGEPSWLIDGGASKHMTGDLKLLKDHEGISPTVIDLPSGDQTVATKQGSVALGNIGLRKVLYVPKLSWNLILVARVITDLDCTVTFFDNFCVLEDRTSRTLIEVDE